MSRLGLRTRRFMISITASLALAGGAVAVAPPATAAPPDQDLEQKLTSVMEDPRVQAADTAAVVFDPGKKKEIFAHNGREAQKPASNTKLLTAAAAMDDLGPDHRFKTEVITQGRISKKGTTKDLYLKGYGDPTTMESDYRDLAEQVKAAGVKRVTGNLVVDDSYFDDDYYHSTWAPGDRSEYYAAQISALTVSPNTDYDAGTIIVTYSPGAEGEPAEYSLTPAAAEKYVTIKNETQTGTADAENTFDYDRAEGTNTITLSGTVPAETEPTNKWVTVHHPQGYAGAVFAEELKKVGVTVDREKTVERETPRKHRKVIATDHSMKLSDLLTPFMKLSNNSHGEHLTKAMAAKQGKPGNWKDGTKYLERYARSSGGSSAGVHFVDGSGLSHDNRISPQKLVRVLDKIRHEPWFAEYEDALPLAGNPDRMVGGTLSSRMRDTAAENNARAKTGSLNGVTSLSGYVRGADDRLYIFSMLSEYEDETPRPVEDELVVTLAEHSR